MTPENHQERWGKLRPTGGEFLSYLDRPKDLSSIQGEKRDSLTSLLVLLLVFALFVGVPLLLYWF